jgi:hydroxymethylpyrimidine pyrophosphatase-like HAD family hydrolase
MRYHALATDYDGTVATHGTLDDATTEALARLRATGRKLLLVTGRQIADLETVCPDLGRFDAIVAENGALVYHPSSREVRPLAAAPPPELVEALRARGVEPISAGQIVVATLTPHENTVLEVIRALGLELQVSFNKGAVMVLPSGVNKATGLDAALSELGLSRHNVVAIGDAENDHALLSSCACGVAVANAIDSLKARADWVTPGGHGEGVRALVEALLRDDLAELGPRLTRHDVVLGRDEADDEVRVPAYGGSLLVTGTSGGGKSTIVTGLVERMTEQGYQQCIVDPEGDYANHDEGAVVLGSAQHAPTVDEVIDVLASPGRNVVANLLGLALDERPLFATRLLPRLLDLRARFGRPHWIVLDETHHLLPASWQEAEPALAGHLIGMLLVTVHPKHVSPVVLRAVDQVVATGRAPQEALDEFAAARGERAPRLAAGATDLPAGEAFFWSLREGRIARVRTLPGRGERTRHARKYAEGALEPDESFYFRGPGERLNLRAQNLQFFLQVADGVDTETWLYHLRRRDYSAWMRRAIKDEGLAGEVAAIEAAAADHQGADEGLADETRRRVRAAVETHYTAPA